MLFYMSISSSKLLKPYSRALPFIYINMNVNIRKYDRGVKIKLMQFEGNDDPRFIFDTDKYNSLINRAYALRNF